MNYNKYGLPEDDKYNNPWLFIGLGAAVIAVVILLLVGIILIYQSC